MRTPGPPLQSIAVNAMGLALEPLVNALRLRRFIAIERLASRDAIAQCV